MKRTNTSVKQKKSQPKPVKSVVKKEKSSTSKVGTPASVKNTLKALNPDAYKRRENKKYMKDIADIRHEQEKFYNNVVMTSVFMNVFNGNPDDFHLLIGNEIIEKYQFEKSWDNPEWVWESVDEMCSDMAFGVEHFTVVGNGLFRTLHLTTKKKAMKLDDIIRSFVDYMGEEWDV